MIRRCFEWFQTLLHQPMKVFWLCLALGVAGVILDGTALRLWSLHRDHRQLEEKIAESARLSRQLEFRIQEAQQPEFIERQARDQFDLVKEGDLVFIFSEDGGDGGAGQGASGLNSLEKTPRSLN
jgi:cell division protein FtsB